MPESLRLFLVEDDDTMALVVRRGLERAGHHVTCCHAGEDAIIVLHQAQFDLVILDWKLDTMTAATLLENLHRDNISPPVLIITKYGNEEVATRVWRAGVLDYINKDDGLLFLADLPKRVSDSVQRHRTEQHNRLLSAALESARDGVAITDLEGRFLHVNQALERMTGYNRQELLGQTPRLFKSDRHRHEFYAEIWRTVLARACWQGELINRRKDGSQFDVSLTVSPIVDSRGALTHFVGIYRDIGERIQLERQLLHAQKMQSVGTLAGGVAHEFNNLLAGIQGYAALGLREPQLTPTLQQFLEYVMDLSERAANLTGVAGAALASRALLLIRQPTAMDTLLLDTAELVRHSLSLEVELELPVYADSPRRNSGAWADWRTPSRLQQVINLLNARPAESAQAAAFPFAALDFGCRTAGLSRQRAAGRLCRAGSGGPGQRHVAGGAQPGAGPVLHDYEIGQERPCCCGVWHRSRPPGISRSDATSMWTTVRLYLPRLTDARARPGGRARCRCLSRRFPRVAIFWWWTTNRRSGMWSAASWRSPVIASLAFLVARKRWRCWTRGNRRIWWCWI